MFQEIILGGTTAPTVSPSQLTLDEQLSICLHEHGDRLRRMAESSPVATRSPLEEDIERIENILEVLSPPRSSGKEVSR